MLSSTRWKVVSGKLRGLPPRLLLACGSVLLTLLLLEGATRLLVAPPAPVQLRDGIYVSQLAKVNGRDTVLSASGAPLPEKKRDGEIRIFVFGESSVQGSPWGYFGSPPTLLHDQLRAVVPGKDITVVNMGRGAGYMIDSYYFLASIGRFSPDYVVVYQGGNDSYRYDREMCMPATHPTLYRGWRWIAEHSRFAWTVRAQGPQAIANLVHPGGGSRSDSPMGSVDLCDDTTAFRGWSEILSETGRAMGAHVILTTPVQNPLRWAEDGGAFSNVDLPLHPADREEGYRRLLACILTDGCDVPAVWSEVRPAGRNGAGYQRDYWGEPRPRAMLEAAAATGARGIDLYAYLEKRAAGGLSPLLFADEVHLTLEGSSQVAWQWTSLLGPDLGSGPLPELPLPVDRERYLGDIFRHGGNGGLGGAGQSGRACLLFSWATLYLRVNMALIAGSILEQAVALDTPAKGVLPTTRAGLQARLLIGWLRQLDGLDPELPPALAARLGEVNVAEMTRQLREHPDCSTLGGPGPLPGETVGGYDPPGSLHAIPPGREALFLAMLGGGEIEGCSLQGAEIQSAQVRARYRCSGGKEAVVELHHPSEAVPALARTAKFSLVAADPAPSEALIRTLADRIRSKEEAFEWLVVTHGEHQDSTPAVAHPRSAALPRILGGAGVALAGLLVLWQRRRRRARIDAVPEPTARAQGTQGRRKE
jgi:hypothetical protein